MAEPRRRSSGEDDANGGSPAKGLPESLAIGWDGFQCASFSPHASLTRHEHRRAYLCIVVAGSYLERDRNELACRAGMLIAHPDGHAHANEFGSGGAICLDVPVETGSPLGALTRDYSHTQLAGTGAFARLGRSLRATDSTRALAATGAVYELASLAADERRSYSNVNWTRRVVDILEADLSVTPSLTELARAVDLHPAHVSKGFRIATGESVGEYLRRRRLERADALLRSAELSLAEVAAEAGFYDQSHFTRLYHAYFARTPAAVRRDALRPNRSVDAIQRDRRR